MSSQLSTTELHLLTAFSDPVVGSQWVYRQLLKAMSEPGTILSLMDGNQTPTLYATDFTNDYLYPTTWSVAQALLDSDCCVHVSPRMSQQDFLQSLHFYTDAKVIEDAKKANFAFMTLEELVGNNEMASSFSSGSLIAPHESCTLIIQVSDIRNAVQLALQGPGIKTQKQLAITGVESQMIRFLQANNQLYPCGVDFIFCSPTHIVALPRSTVVSSSSSASEVA